MAASIDLRAGRLRRFLPLVCVSLALAVLGVAGAAAAQTQRILLVGDSWVAQAWEARAFQTALQNKGLGQYEEVGGVTAIGGSTAAQWATAPYLALITQELQAHPEIDIVHLSIGGNDFLDSPGTPLGELINQVLGDIQTVVDHILAVRPEARIAYSIYDYVPAGYNTELGFFAVLLINHAAATDGYFFLNNLGVRHHAFGYPGEFGPGETPLPGGYPDYIPIQGGNPAFPGSPTAFDDSIHPNDASYVRLAEHAIDEFYAEWLAPPPVPAVGPAGHALLAAALLLGGLGAARLRPPAR